MTISDQCVSLATGTLSPDKRVNYVRGMVLGVDEFLQEQQYFLQKDYLHERGLHGYGTAYGLAVTTSPVNPASPSDTDYQVQVGPGVAIDQWGREIVIRSPQCANLGAWLATQEQATVAGNLDPSGALTVYLVASYDTCLDDLVPLPGQPCSSSAQTQVASRVRDAWDLELRWAPPAMPAWDADRRLARLLDSVQLVPGLDPSLSEDNENAIINDVQALATSPEESPSGVWPPALGWPAVSGPSGVLQLAAETAADAFDKILTVWATQVRPLLAPDLTDPDPASDPAILLTTVTFTPASPFVLTNPALDSAPDLDDSGRPYLLHTRLIQEMSRAGASALPSSPQQLATLGPVVTAGGLLTSVTAAFHLEVPVQLTVPIQIASTGAAGSANFIATTTDPSGFSSLWTLTPPADFLVADGDQITATFGGGTVFVGTASTTLAQAETALSLMDVTPTGDVLAYAPVQIPPPSQAAASKEFVTITSNPTRVNNVPAAVVELWFHPQPTGRPTIQLPEIAVEVLSLLVTNRSGTQISVTGPIRNSTEPNSWYFTVEGLGSIIEPFPQVGVAYLRLIIDATKTMVAEPGGIQISLADWIAREQIEFVGWDPSNQQIVSFARAQGPAATAAATTSRARTSRARSTRETIPVVREQPA